MKIGDKVAYSVQFLKSIGELTGDMPAGRGTIVQIRKFGSSQIATIDWDRDLPKNVNVANLAKVGLNVRFSSC